MDLQDPTTKMSTTYSSENGLIYVDDDADAIRKKLKRAQTDSGSEVRRGEGKEGIANLIEIMSVARGVDAGARSSRSSRARATARSRGPSATRWPTCSRPCASATRELRGDERALEATLQEGAERARAIASGTLAEARAAMGVGPAGLTSQASA